MALSAFIVILSKLALGAVATFLAIMVWARTREAAWVLVAAGVLAAYLGIVYEAIKLFGIVRQEDLLVSGIPVAELVAQDLPTVLFIAGFVAFLIRRRIR